MSVKREFLVLITHYKLNVLLRYSSGPTSNFILTLGENSFHPEDDTDPFELERPAGKF